jgi:predicted ATPase
MPVLSPPAHAVPAAARSLHLPSGMSTSVMPMQRRCRIVLTGGPGGGKTTAADLLRRELGERVVVVPEAATILFGGGFPRYEEEDARRAAQSAIYHVQRNVENVQSARYPDRVLLCDRGTVDGGAYWPGGSDGYFRSMGTSLHLELQRYDAVVFFETAAVAGISIEGGNAVRCESLDQAAALDQRLRELWSQHPRFALVPHSTSFFQKITAALAILQGVVQQLDPRL